MRFIGVDLAWSDHNPTGLVVVNEQGQVESAAYVTALDAVAGFCLARAGEEPAIVAVDAPLSVLNDTGHREADRAIMRLFRGRRLGVHSANRERLLAVHGGVRGEALVRQLGGRFSAARGAQDGGAFLPGNTIIEVYPHAALIAWFDLPAPLPYKRGHLLERRQGLRRLVELLRQLKGADPPLDVDSAPWVLADGEEDLSTAQLDQIESLLDALVAAHVASFCRRWGAARCACLSEAGGPGLVTPVPGEKRLK
ncbi:MAG: DUF429 domain-containing protein [Bacillota bacterium]